MAVDDWEGAHFSAEPYAEQNREQVELPRIDSKEQQHDGQGLQGETNSHDAFAAQMVGEDGNSEPGDGAGYRHSNEGARSQAGRYTLGLGDGHQVNQNNGVPRASPEMDADEIPESKSALGLLEKHTGADPGDLSSLHPPNRLVLRRAQGPHTDLRRLVVEETDQSKDGHATDNAWYPEGGTQARESTAKSGNHQKHYGYGDKGPYSLGRLQQAHAGAQMLPEPHGHRGSKRNLEYAH